MAVEDRGNDAPALDAFWKECLTLFNLFACSVRKLGDGVAKQHGVENALHTIPIRFKPRKRVSVTRWRLSLSDAIAKDGVQLRIIQSNYGLPINAQAT